MDKLPVPKSHTLNEENVKKFIEAVDNDEVRKIVRIMLNNTVHISYNEFSKQIRRLLPQAITSVVEDRPIFVYVDTNYSEYFYKSNYWMFMMVKSAIKENRKQIKLVNTLDDERIINGDIILLIDDCMYSGIQTSNTIANMQNTKNKSVKILLFVPYISKASLELVNEKFADNKQLRNCSLQEPENCKIIIPFGYYINEKQAELLADYYPHLSSKWIMEAYPIYFDHKVAKYRSSFPAVYAGIVPNANNRYLLYLMVSQYFIGLDISKNKLENYKRQGFADENKLKELKEYIQYHKKFIKRAELQMTIIPLLNNCENMRVSAAKHIFESSCPVPPYKSQTSRSIRTKSFTSAHINTSRSSVSSRSSQSRQKSI